MFQGRSHAAPKQQPFSRQPIRPSATPRARLGAIRSAVARSGMRYFRQNETRPITPPKNAP